MTHLKIGDKAPNFEGKNQIGNLISLSGCVNNKLILYFYPKDNTPGCTKQACSLSESYSELTKNGFRVIGVSPDNELSHMKFIKKYNLSFDLIADVDKKICKEYGVFGQKKFMGREYEGVHRTTFIINQDKIIEKIFHKVDTAKHSSQILESYNN
ncbi:MAG: thioredoxin-dependent thiol peroxidase [Flavobacteriales bacterium]|nr:thioredoxin-dependent thiol peroxidase [Flavobacteriales bacterium]